MLGGYPKKHAGEGSYMCTTHALQLEGPDDVGGQLLRVCQGHAHHPVGLCTSRRPILKYKVMKNLKYS